jgi:hypothetical protein
MKNKHLINRYDSLEDFIRAAERKPLNHEKRSSRREGNADFFGTHHFDEAVDLARFGWPKGRENMMSAMAEAQLQPCMTPSYTMDVAGAYPIAAVAAAGDPCSMVDLTPVEDRVRPIIRLVVLRNGTASYTAKHLTSYGAVALSYIEGLESAGFRVEVEIGFSDDFGHGHELTKNHTAVIVKRSQDPLDIDKMAFCLTHAAMWRRLCWGVWESSPDVEAKLPHGYGRTRETEPGIDTEPSQIILPAIGIVSSESPALKSPQAAMRHFGPIIERQLREAGLAPPPLSYGEAA